MLSKRPEFSCNLYPLNVRCRTAADTHKKIKDDLNEQTDKCDCEPIT